MSVIVITGAAGLVGSMLRPRLARPDRTLRLLDLVPLTAGPGEEAIQASVTDLDAMTAACQGADAVIHLAGIPGEASWPRILETNINGGYGAFEAARRAGTPRVIFASSNHAVGFTPREAFPVPDYAFPAPDTYYGISKAATEAMAAMYHYRYGLDAICVRILSCFPRPANVRMLSTWLSPDDTGRLFEACLTAERPGFRVIFGVSANTRGGWVSLAEARALGYQPQDDAEAYAAEIIAEHGEPDPDRPGAALPGRRVHPPRRAGPPGLRPSRLLRRPRRGPSARPVLLPAGQQLGHLPGGELEERGLLGHPRAGRGVRADQVDALADQRGPAAASPGRASGAGRPTGCRASGSSPGESRAPAPCAPGRAGSGNAPPRTRRPD